MLNRRNDKPSEVVPVEATPVAGDALAPVAPELVPEAKEFAARSRADNTKRAYEAQWSRFTRWCEAKGVAARPADRRSVANYLTYLASFGREPDLDKALKRKGPLKASSIAQARAVIGKAHTDTELPSPADTREVLDVWEGIQRTLGGEVDKKAPIMPDQLAAMLDLAPDSLLGLRDRAILLLGWAGAFRRSELVSLDVEDLFRGDEHGTLVAFLRKSKTDQRGTGKRKPILPSQDERLCPVRAVAAWLKESGIVTGPLFRPASPDGRSLLERRLSDDMVYETVVRYAEGADLDPGMFGSFAAHSLRAGFCTTAAEAGKDLDQIMQVTGHAKVDTLLGYVRNSKLFTDRSAGRGLLDGVKKSTKP